MPVLVDNGVVNIEFRQRCRERVELTTSGKILLGVDDRGPLLSTHVARGGTATDL